MVPWGVDVNEAMEGSIVLVNADSVKEDGVAYQISKQNSLETLEDAFKVWLQELQLISLNRGPQTKQVLEEKGRIALEIMRFFVDSFQSDAQAADGGSNKKKTFGQRILNFILQKDLHQRSEESYGGSPLNHAN
jgi:hypothetical protein